MIKYVEKWEKEVFGLILPDKIVLNSMPFIAQLRHIYELFDSSVVLKIVYSVCEV